MKTNILTLTLLVLFYASAFGQISLGTNDFPKSNRIYNLSTARPFTGMDATLTGANYTWDYTQLATTRNGSRVDTFISVAATAQLYAIAFAFNSNHAITGADFALGTFITVTNAFNFFDNTSSLYKQSGFGANVNSIPTPVVYSSPDIIYRYPVAFGNVDSCTPAYTISIPNFIYYGVNMTRHNTVDGWGMLTTPYGTFNALRIKSVITEIDTFHLDTLPIGFPAVTRPTRTEYKWLGTGKGDPLLQINMTGANVTSIAYLDSVRTNGVTTEQQPFLDLEVFPNPASKEVYVQYSLASPSTTTIHFDVLDLSGAIVFSVEEKITSAGVHFIRLDIPATVASGDYFVRVTQGAAQVMKPLVIAR